MSAKRGIFLPPFDELVDPNTLVELATLAEERGWDGFFLWDHIAYRAPVRAVADPWVALAAIAQETEKLWLGPMVTRSHVGVCRRWPGRRPIRAPRGDPNRRRRRSVGGGGRNMDPHRLRLSSAPAR